jgi:hypothetical protein
MSANLDRLRTSVASKYHGDLNFELLAQAVVELDTNATDIAARLAQLEHTFAQVRNQIIAADDANAVAENRPFSRLASVEVAIVVVGESGAALNTNFPLPAGETFEEPPPGAIDAAINGLRDEIRQALDVIRMDIGATQQMSNRVVELLERTQKQLTFAQRLEAFFGPLLEGKTPPLDGAMIATREYVDAGIATFARSIRSEIRDATELLKAFGRLTIGSPDEKIDAAMHLPAGATLGHRIAHRLSSMWGVTADKVRAALEPAPASRLDLLRALITGGR